MTFHFMGQIFQHMGHLASRYIVFLHLALSKFKTTQVPGIERFLESVENFDVNITKQTVSQKSKKLYMYDQN